MPPQPDLLHDVVVVFQRRVLEASGRSDVLQIEEDATGLSDFFLVIRDLGPEVERDPHAVGQRRPMNLAQVRLASRRDGLAARWNRRLRRAIAVGGGGSGGADGAVASASATVAVAGSWSRSCSACRACRTRLLLG